MPLTGDLVSTSRSKGEGRSGRITQSQASGHRAYIPFLCTDVQIAPLAWGLPDPACAQAFQQESRQNLKATHGPRTSLHPQPMMKVF